MKKFAAYMFGWNFAIEAKYGKNYAKDANFNVDGIKTPGGYLS